VGRDGAGMVGRGPRIRDSSRGPFRQGAAPGDESVLGAIRQSLVRRWLEVLLPAYTLAFLLVMLRPEYMPGILGHRPGEFLLPWVAWAVVGAMSGILILWGLIVAFFLLYSPFYLVGKVPMIVGRGAWVDRRELYFYLCCFAMLVGLVGLLAWEPRQAVVAFTVVSGCGPVLWRYLV
jgi:hypothetical protein